MSFKKKCNHIQLWSLSDYIGRWLCPFKEQSVCYALLIYNIHNTNFETPNYKTWGQSITSELHSPISAHPSSEVITASLRLYEYYCFIFLFSHYFLHELDQSEDKWHYSHPGTPPILYAEAMPAISTPTAIVLLTLIIRAGIQIQGSRVLAFNQKVLISDMKDELLET